MRRSRDERREVDALYWSLETYGRKIWKKEKEKKYFVVVSAYSVWRCWICWSIAIMSVCLSVCLCRSNVLSLDTSIHRRPATVSHSRQQVALDSCLRCHVVCDLRTLQRPVMSLWTQCICLRPSTWMLFSVLMWYSCHGGYGGQKWGAVLYFYLSRYLTITCSWC